LFKTAVKLPLEEEIEERCHSPWVIGDNRQQRLNSLKLLVPITRGDKRFPLLLLLVATKTKRKRKRKGKREVERVKKK